MIPQELFTKQAAFEKEKLQLLEQFQMPDWETRSVDWKQLAQTSIDTGKKKWNEVDVYRELTKHKKSPAIYALFVEPGYGKQLFDDFTKAREIHAKTRKEQGLHTAGYCNLSYSGSAYNGSDCIYVGSRKKDLHERFKQHLGYGAGRTGALHLAKLYPSGEPPPTFFYYAILNDRYGCITEMIECVVQKYFKPFIGKELIREKEVEAASELVETNPVR